MHYTVRRHGLGRILAQLAGADVGLFYYAGHGVQVRGENYLIPVDANPTKEADVDFQMLATNLVLRQMEGAGTKLNIVILDACRNNPFGGRSLAVGRSRDRENDRMRDAGGGLAQMQAPEGTLISFATQPGSVAQDGADGNSPYTRALALSMRRPGLDIFQTFNKVGLTVKRSTGGLQLPWVSTSPIDGNFYFVPPPTGPVSAAAPAGPQVAPPTPSADDIQWGILKDASDIGLLRRFIEMNPNSKHRAEAEQRVVALTAPLPPSGFQTPAIGGAATAELTDRRDMTRQLQLELKRVGCFDGAADGEFSNPTRAALRTFAKLAALSLPDDLSLNAVNAVRGIDKRVCPLVCQSGERPDGDRCIRSTCP